jgi:transposase
MKCLAHVVAGLTPNSRGEEAVLRRHELTDDQWNAIKNLLPGKEGDPGVTAKDNRLFGQWHNVFQRFNRWCKKGVFTRIFEVLRDPDLEVLMLDSTVIRAHQHSAGQKNSTPEQEQLGRSRGGVGTKIHVAVDGLGKPTRIILSPGQDHDVTKAPDLIRDSEADKVIADKAYDSDALIDQIKAQGATPVIPPRENRKDPRDYDHQDYKKRNVVERFINVLKQCRRVATRYEKTARNFLGFVLFASTLVALS